MGPMVDSWKLTTIGMWVDKLDKEGALSLICDTFDWDELWEAAAELNQLCAARKLENHIARNRDLGDQRDRVRILGTAVLSCLQLLKSQDEAPVFVVTSDSLAMVPGVVKSNVKADPAVSSRLDNMEKMLENLSKGFQEMKSNQKEQWPTIQVNGGPPPQPAVGAAAHQVQCYQAAVIGNRGRQQLGIPSVGLGMRSRSDSRKRKAEEEHVQQAQRVHNPGHRDQAPHGEQGGWTDVPNRGRRRQVQYGTSKLRISGGDAAPYDVFVGNTHPDSTEENIREVLKKVSETLTDELKLPEPLEILQVECLTKPRDDGRKLWAKNWRVQVPNRFREHMLRPEAYPIGWSSRRYFPARAPRQPVPPLDPTVQGPVEKRPHLGPGPDNQASATAK